MFFLPFLATPMQAQPLVTYDAIQKIATVMDGSTKLKFKLDFSQGCIVNSMEIAGREVLALKKGGWSGIKVGGNWYTTAVLVSSPKISKKGNQLRITDIEYGGGGVRVLEGWTFTTKDDSIQWKIDRHFLEGGVLEDTAMPQTSFATMSTWTGALLGSGGVAWGKLFDAPNATYGIHTDSASLWNSTSDASLQFSAASKSRNNKALRFTREPNGVFSMAVAITPHELQPKHAKSRFQRERQDIWAPFTVSKSQVVSETFEFKAVNFQETFGRGDFKGLNTKSITELINTIGRIGVIDKNLVGSNGWYSGYICMHEPWLARVGTAINDPNYLQTCAGFLDYAREHAVLPDGMVKSRWKYDAGDAQPGTYDEKSGFYEAQWGRLMDSQTSYVTNVADLFDLNGDKEWVTRQKQSCESALDYLLRRDVDGDGLVEMTNSLMSQRRSSDWLDIVWASHENAFVNAQLYGALQKWSIVEDVLGDKAKADAYRRFAEKLKLSFNKSIKEGGFWNPEKGWYVYWRDADGSVHGDNLTVHINLTALGEGLCDDPFRKLTLLNTMETRMNQESLLAWPACFDSFEPGEGADDKFPTYENGDVFLAWAEYGIRAYAQAEPKTALKYLRRIVDQYQKDGLAYQRYLRADGRGAGDDILANNCNVITGLYRDIYGIQPKFNRLYLAPNLVSELNGSRVDYNLRGDALKIRLSVGDYRVVHDRISVQSSKAFGVTFEANQFTYFAADQSEPEITVKVGGKESLTASFEDWNQKKVWGIVGSSGPIIAIHTFHGLKPGSSYRVVSNGKTIATVSHKRPIARIPCPAGTNIKLELLVSYSS